MQTLLAQTPFTGYMPADRYEYLLVVNPGMETTAQLAEEKKQFYRMYGEEGAITTKPHLTVASFTASEAMEETLIRYMRRILSANTGFGVMLNNYSGNPTGEVFIRVQQPEPFKRLAEGLKAIDHYIRSNGYPAANLITRPHVTIAGRLPETVYSKAMLDYSQRIFNTTFVVNELLLLKRKGPFDTGKQVNIFKLLPCIGH